MGIETNPAPPPPRLLKDPKKIEEGFRLVLEGLGISTEAPHFRETPERAAKAWWNELCRGLTHGPPRITTFESDSNEMVVLNNVPINSMCAHHLLPFKGNASIGYIQNCGRILGLSKLSRIADFIARRPHVQEELTRQIAQYVADHVLQPSWRNNLDENIGGGVGVVIKATHLCMAIRGVNHSGEMVTSSLIGTFKADSAVRAEFMGLAGG